MLDTTPIYPRPSPGRVREAMKRVFRIAECVAPEHGISGDALIRAIAHDGITPAQALWAVHDLLEQRGLLVYHINERPSHIRFLIFHDNPPVGVEMAKGRIHIDPPPPQDSWGSFVFEFN